MLALTAAVVAAAFSAPSLVSAFPTGTTRCPPLSGNLTLHQFQLYPEKIVWDPTRCVFYNGALYNSSLVTYDPYQNKVVSIRTFDGITGNAFQHIGGTGYDPVTDSLTIISNPANEFITGGKDRRGTPWAWSLNLKTGQQSDKTNLTVLLNDQFSGFQDVVYDTRGNVYLIGTQPSSIVKFDPTMASGSLWWGVSPGNFSQSGIAGAATVGDVIVADDGLSGDLLRFDATQSKGEPETVKVTPAHKIATHSDAIYFPEAYCSTVLLVTEDEVGVSVFRSRDRQWREAEYLGLIAKDDIVPQDSFITTVLTVTNSIYVLPSFFLDNLVTFGAGNRSDFPLIDITARVAALAGAAPSSCSSKC
ncbi:hypothetical protein DFJ73DRAFT_769348 [Zopfochytrium polystomum]|nr:hypothetical protein DFJ73DRAFT_769348 [Zopfochytrium polystomum]